MSVEAQLFLQEHTEAPAVFPFGAGEVVVFTRPSPDREGPNEDSAVLASLVLQRDVMAVADGAGGGPQGAKASALALEGLLHDLERAARAEVMLREAILSGFETANRMVTELGGGAGTTLAVVGLEGGAIRTYHVGDSAVLVVGQRGKRKLETVAHSPVGYAVEAGFLDEREAMHHEERHLVNNLLGGPEMRVEMSAKLRLAARDTLLIGSDGLFDNLHVDELVDLIRKGPLRKVAADLVERTSKRMLDPRDGAPSKQDDLTFILYRPST